MSIIETEKLTPVAPEDLTEITVLDPVAPSSVSTVADLEPAAPSNLTELPDLEPLAPTNINELAKVKAAVPANLVELSDVEPAVPATIPRVTALEPLAPLNLTEIPDLEPIAPSNLVEGAVLMPLAPTDFTELEPNFVDSELTPLIDIDFTVNKSKVAGQLSNSQNALVIDRATSATYIDDQLFSDGKNIRIIKNDYAGTAVNKILNSNNLTSSSFTNVNCNVFSSTSESPVGSAFSLQPISTSSGAYIRQDISPLTGEHTLSAYVKANGIKNAVLVVIGSASFAAGFNLINGSVYEEGLAAVSQATDVGAEFLGDGWYRIYFTCVLSAATSFRVYADDGGGDGRVSTYLDGDELLLAGFQINAGNKIAPFIRTFDTEFSTVFASTPRFGYDHNSDDDKGLILETSATNLLTYSENFSDASWTKVSAVVSQNAGLAPDGSLNASIIKASASGSFLGRVAKTLSGISNANTFSAYLKKGSTDIVYIVVEIVGVSTRRVWVDLANGTILSEGDSGEAYSRRIGIEDAYNGWYRVSIQVTWPATASTVTYYVAPAAEDGSVNAVSGQYFMLWGMQVESGYCATSYIKTTSSQVTRAFDNCDVADTNPINLNNFALMFDSSNKRTSSGNLVEFFGGQVRTSSIGSSIITASNITPTTLTSTDVELRKNIVITCNGGVIAVYMNGELINDSLILDPAVGNRVSFSRSSTSGGVKCVKAFHFYNQPITARQALELSEVKA